MHHHHQTAAFLLKASNFLPTNAQYTTVRTHLMSKYRELVRRPLGDVNRCSTCGTDFKTALPSHHIEPVLAPNRFQRRHLRDEQQCKTKYQALRMKQFHTKIHNQQKLVTVCPMCKKTHVTKLTKPSNIITTKVIKQVSTKQKKNAKKKLKRLQKKKNRAFAGLNENVVLSVVNNLKNSGAPSAVMCSSDTAAPSAGDNVINNVDRSPIIISDSLCAKLHCDSVIELSENETDKSVILLSSPASTNSNLQDSDVFFIDTSPSTSSTKPKKINKPTLVNPVKALSSKITPIKPTVARSSNTNIKQVQKRSPKLTKKQKKLLKQNNTNVNSTFVTEIASTSKQNVVKKKANKNTILVQPLKKDKKSQKLNSLSNLLNNNNTRTKSTSMLTEFLKTIT